MARKLHSHDLRVHFIRQALYWRREARRLSNQDMDKLAEWCKGRYVEAIEAVSFVRRLAA